MPKEVTLEVVKLGTPTNLESSIDEPYGDMWEMWRRFFSMGWSWPGAILYDDWLDENGRKDTDNGSLYLYSVLEDGIPKAVILKALEKVVSEGDYQAFLFNEHWELRRVVWKVMSKWEQQKAKVIGDLESLVGDMGGKTRE